VKRSSESGMLNDWLICRVEDIYLGTWTVMFHKVYGWKFC
jgi:hypothetical protein